MLVDACLRTSGLQSKQGVDVWQDVYPTAVHLEHPNALWPHRKSGCTHTANANSRPSKAAAPGATAPSHPPSTPALLNPLHLVSTVSLLLLMLHATPSQALTMLKNVSANVPVVSSSSKRMSLFRE